MKIRNGFVSNSSTSSCICIGWMLTLDDLVDLAFKRNRERQNRTYSYDQNILALGNGVKGTKGAKK